MRFNAYRRSRIVDECVTPDFIKEIDIPVRFVARQTLIHAALQPTDWSIDPLDNDGANTTVFAAAAAIVHNLIFAFCGESSAVATSLPLRETTIARCDGSIAKKSR